MKSKVTFYGGLNTVGGVVMVVEYGKERVILEMGRAYVPDQDVYDGFLLPRKDHYLYDELTLGRAPRIDGLYNKENLKGFPLEAVEDSSLHTSIFITHMHLDHMSNMGIVGDQVDVYLSEPAMRLENALEDVGEGVVTLRHAPYKLLEPDKTYILGDIILKPFLLNAKSYQDYSFYLKTPDLKLHYTGDLMMHGDYADAVYKEMDYIKNEHVDALVVDCTTFMDSTMKMMYGDVHHEVQGEKELPKGMMNKEMVDEELGKILCLQDGLCVFNFYEREMSDVLSFEAMAKKANRMITFEPKTAYLIYKFYNRLVPIFQNDYSEYENTSWFKELKDQATFVDFKDILANPKNYLLQITYPHSLDLFDLPSKNASYLHAGGTPIGAFDPAYENLMHILKEANFTHINFFMDNYFTHAYPSQVKYYCDEIDAKVLIPTHGLNPERLFPGNNRLRLLPKLGVTYTFDGEKFVED